ncbi:hypothetical protein CA51_17780 [Rosistilla oblonga]|uniref:Uncharacterized protein n=2 Tax=Rosistilla TaxID=2795779 RepID=A0A518IRT2_9BACT|nr:MULTISPECIES: response regulator [Rosistilla]QDS88038.1 hypothetical protein EC9_22240 [Rosistilla ulvae]QDV11902.1 hypothetical protein CA51_17780 [Rosistilla oblonga]QDV55784.1 hypothetical protein Mal33_17630 [Rosistilla oblonga]
MTHRFVQPCPTCGRKLEIGIELLGRAVACQHCLAEFTAADPTSTQSILDDDSALLARVDQALQRADNLLTTNNNADANLTAN